MHGAWAALCFEGTVCDVQRLTGPQNENIYYRLLAEQLGQSCSESSRCSANAPSGSGHRAPPPQRGVGGRQTAEGKCLFHLPAPYIWMPLPHHPTPTCTPGPQLRSGLWRPMGNGSPAWWVVPSEGEQTCLRRGLSAVLCGTLRWWGSVSSFRAAIPGSVC